MTEDIPSIMGLGRSTAAFAVSDQIKFYEEVELCEWIADPKHNIVLVLTLDGAVEGFLFCKLMSSHWALLDNLFVRRTAALHAGGATLLNALQDRLRVSGRSYLSILIRNDRPALVRIAGANGFVSRDVYQWMDRFL